MDIFRKSKLCYRQNYPSVDGVSLCEIQCFLYHGLDITQVVELKKNMSNIWCFLCKMHIINVSCVTDIAQCGARSEFTNSCENLEKNEVSCRSF